MKKLSLSLIRSVESSCTVLLCSLNLDPIHIPKLFVRLFFHDVYWIVTWRKWCLAILLYLFGHAFLFCKLTLLKFDACGFREWFTKRRILHDAIFLHKSWVIGIVFPFWKFLTHYFIYTDPCDICWLVICGIPEMFGLVLFFYFNDLNEWDQIEKWIHTLFNFLNISLCMVMRCIFVAGLNKLLL